VSDRERERDRDTCIYDICVCVYIYVNVYQSIPFVCSGTGPPARVTVIRRANPQPVMAVSAVGHSSSGAVLGVAVTGRVAVKKGYVTMSLLVCGTTT